MDAQKLEEFPFLSGPSLCFLGFYGAGALTEAILFPPETLEERPAFVKQLIIDGIAAFGVAFCLEVLCTIGAKMFAWFLVLLPLVGCLIISFFVWNRNIQRRTHTVKTGKFLPVNRSTIRSVQLLRQSTKSSK